MFSKLNAPEGMLQAYEDPPDSPARCVFAQSTDCFASDLERRITPCQFGGKPDCLNCGCAASAGLAAVARHRVSGVPLGQIFTASLAVGRTVARLRRAIAPAEPVQPTTPNAPSRVL